eukprot:1147992-Pelagomonas_calceolata.AAC.13
MVLRCEVIIGLDDLQVTRGSNHCTWLQSSANSETMCGIDYSRSKERQHVSTKHGHTRTFGHTLEEYVKQYAEGAAHG